MKTLATLIFSCLFSIASNPTKTSIITVTWADKLDEDFSFAKRQSILCEAWCYEWAGTNKIVAIQKPKDTVFCYTVMNAATHCSLHLSISENTFIPTIILKSIVRGGDKVYESESGNITIDKTLWKQKTLKASFDINFKNGGNDKKIFWKGKIYTKIR